MEASARYSRQIAYGKVGRAGQERLCASRAVVIGIGALGTVAANCLARAGVGRLRLVDRDYVEESNLQRQSLFSEADAREGLPKAQAAAAALMAVNSGIALEPVIADVNSGNVERLIEGADVVVDGSDNFEIRYLLNDACLRQGIPWVYGGAIMDSGVTMNILPGKGPCLRCLLPSIPPAGTQATCASAGVLNMITGVIANIEAVEALKILLGSPNVRRTFLSIGLWDSVFQEVEIERDPSCPACAEGRYEFLDRPQEAYSTLLCGRDSAQICPAPGLSVDFEAMAQRLRPLGELRVSPFMLVLLVDGREIRLFRDGRAIITKVKDAASARSIYSEYIGL